MWQVRARLFLEIMFMATGLALVFNGLDDLLLRLLGGTLAVAAVAFRVGDLVPKGKVVSHDVERTPHPGEALGERLVELKLTKAAAARQLKVPRSTFSRIVEGKSPMNVRCAKALEEHNIGKAKTWMKMQVAYDLDRAA